MGADQKAVDQIRLQVGFGGAGDDQQLIDIGDDDLLAAAGRAAEHRAARLDALDDAFVSPGAAKQHEIAGGHDVPLIGAERFEQPPRGTHVQRAVGSFDGAGQAMNGQGAAALQRRHVDVQQQSKSGLLSFGHRAQHGALAGQLPLAADALLANGVQLGVAPLGVEDTSPVVRAGTLAAILAEGGANLVLLLVSHQSWGCTSARRKLKTRAGPAGAVAVRTRNHTGRLGSLI